MIDFYTWSTPNGRKISIMLEETELPYRTIPVDIANGEQFQPAFLALNPNGRIPVIVDGDAAGGPYAVIESGAILIYLAEKAGRFLPRDVRARSDVLQWLMFQMGGLGPMLGQAGFFLTQAPERIPYAIERYVRESIRLLGVLNTRLAGRDFLGGDYSIADMATYPWVAAAWERGGADTKAAMPNLGRWLAHVGERPAVRRGMTVPLDRASAA